MTNTLVKAVVKQIKSNIEAQQSEIQYCTCPILNYVDVIQNLHVVGSSFLTEFESTKMILTAAHVLDDINEIMLPGEKLVLQPFTFRITNKIINDRKKDKFDFAFSRFDGQYSLEKNNYFFKINSVNVNSPKVVTTLYSIIGFPGSRNKRVFYKRGLKTLALLQTRESESVFNHYKEYDKNIHIFFKAKNFLDHNGNKSGDFHGMSGCPIFAHHIYEIPPIIGNFSFYTDFAGILIEQTDDKKYLVGVNSKFIISNLKKYQNVHD